MQDKNLEVDLLIAVNATNRLSDPENAVTKEASRDELKDADRRSEADSKELGCIRVVALVGSEVIKVVPKAFEQRKDEVKRNEDPVEPLIPLYVFVGHLVAGHSVRNRPGNRVVLECKDPGGFVEEEVLGKDSCAV